MRSEVLGAASLEPRRVTFEQRETQRAHRRSRDLFLDREDVLEQPVECLRPEQRAVGGDELGGDTHALARLAHAAVEHRAHREQPRDLAVVYGAVLELKGSGAGCDPQSAHPGERIDDLLGGALAEIALVPARTHVGEREHRDGWVGSRRQEGGRWRARSLDRHRRLCTGGAKSACGPLPAPKPHATASATKKPAITSTMMNRSAQSGRPSGTSIVETTWTSSQPAAAYASATRATRPDPSVRQRILYRDSDSPMGSHYRRRPYRGATECVRGLAAGPRVSRGCRPGLESLDLRCDHPSSRPAGPGC